MAHEESLSVGAIILAAGRSSRMGRPKMLLPWGGTTVLGHLIGVWTRLRTGQVAVVHAHGNTAIGSELDRVGFARRNRIINPDPDRGMFSSIVCAAQWAGWHTGLSHWAIVLGDQPHLRPGTLSALGKFAARHPGSVCQPGRSGHGRHPVLLPAAVFQQLATSKAATLKEFLEPMAGEVKLVELDDPGLDVDMDTPEDYERVLRMCFGD